MACCCLKRGRGDDETDDCNAQASDNMVSSLLPSVTGVTDEEGYNGTKDIGWGSGDSVIVRLPMLNPWTIEG